MYKYTTDEAYFHDMFWTTVHHLHPWAKELIKTLTAEQIENAFVNNAPIPSKLTFSGAKFFVDGVPIAENVKIESASISSDRLHSCRNKCNYAKCPFNPKNKINRKNNV